MNGPSYKRYPLATPKIQVDIIDDDAVLRECLATWIGMKAPDIVVVGRFGCWAEATADPDAISDVVVLDILLGDSVPVRTKIKTLIAGGSNVVVLSGVAETTVVRQVLEAGALAYVCKTEAARTLESAIRSAARGERHRVPDNLAGLSLSRIKLSARELEAATIYFTGIAATSAEVGAIMGVTVHTAKKLLMAVHKKAMIGDERLTRPGVRQRLIDEGLLIVEAKTRTEGREPQRPPPGARPFQAGYARRIRRGDQRTTAAGRRRALVPSGAGRASGGYGFCDAAAEGSRSARVSG